MPYTIKITPAEFNDLQKDIDYYNEQQKGLGKKLKSAIHAMFAQLKKVPAAGSFMYDSVRYRVLNKFPYIILYELSAILLLPFIESLILHKILTGNKHLE